MESNQPTATSLKTMEIELLGCPKKLKEIHTHVRITCGACSKGVRGDSSYSCLIQLRGCSPVRLSLIRPQRLKTYRN